ncbi:hypothetical protein [Pandoraea sp. CB10b_02]|uniref:hypothetical protein n=1 Tax=Pandoraea sp. CB10b_02 TaxID=2014535 RepID=UPI00257DD68B|nr:hypothetical protein [Pandoraea sp. CB10b_02]
MAAHGSDGRSRETARAAVYAQTRLNVFKRLSERRHHTGMRVASPVLFPREGAARVSAPSPAEPCCGPSRSAIDDMPHGLLHSLNCRTRSTSFSADAPERMPCTASPRHLAADLALVQQQMAISCAHACRKVDVNGNSPGLASDGVEFALAARHVANVRPDRDGRAVAGLRGERGDTFTRAQHIYAALRDEIAAPALRRRVHPRQPGSAAGPGIQSARREAAVQDPVLSLPWYETLQPHLRAEAQALAQRGLDAPDVRRRFDALMRHERPGLCLRSLRIGMERDALPFAVGSTLIALLVDSVDPERTQAALWPAVEAAGVVLISLMGMARFNACHPALRKKVTRMTPAQGQEALSWVLRHPAREVLAHVVGFVLCYGVIRNGARLGMEAGLSAALPGMMSHRFANTIHAALEILLAPIPGMLLQPTIERISMPAEDARLELLLQDRFADLVADACAGARANVAAPDGWSVFWREMRLLLASAAPRAIWLTLTLGFYFLASLHDGACATRATGATGAADDPSPGAGENSTASPARSDDVDVGIDWHTQALLATIYGTIATAIGL